MGDVLLVTIQVDMHDRLAMTLQDDLTERIVATRREGVLIDISALEIVDSFIGRMLGEHRGDVAHPRRGDGRGRHASGRGHHPRRARPLPARRAHRAERGARDERSCRPRRDERGAWPPSREVRRIRSARRKTSSRSGSSCGPARSRPGFGLVDQTKMVTAASELARNTLMHGGGGQARLDLAPRMSAGGHPTRVRG